MLSCSFFRPQNVYERIAELWNSPAFNPRAPPSACHEDFMSSIDCCHDLVVHLTPATSQRIQDFFTSTRSDLIRIISNWEMSGQGDGGRENEDASVNDNGSSTPSIDVEELPPAAMGGNLCNRPPRALDNRAAFLNGRPSYLLYFWEVADTHQLLASSLQRLRDSVGASSALSPPLISSSRRSSLTSSGGSSRGRRPEGQDENVMAPFVHSLQALADSQQQLLADRAIDRQHEREENSRKRRFHRRSELMDEARRYRRDSAELAGLLDDRSLRLAAFYDSEVAKLEQEILLLESEHNQY